MSNKNASATNLSPEVFARERYINRMEANEKAAAAGGAYDQGVPPYRAKNGLFAGKKKWWWIAGALLIVAIIAVAVGIAVSKSNKKDSATGAVKSDKNDPSNFEKDPDLHQSFYAMCYTPQDAQYDQGCKASIDAVIEDVQLMSQLTTRLRLYGADCGIPSLVLEAIEKTKVNMTVYLATWLPQPSATDATATYQRQVSELTSAIKQYGVDHVDGVTVGNEYLLNGGSETDLISKMADMRTTLKGLNLPKTIPVGTADAGSMVTTSLAQGSDYVMANVHAWFGELPVDQAAGWVWSYTANQEPASALQASPAPELFIAETGWPTGANATQFETLGAAQAGIPELNTFLDTYVCQANQNITAGDKFSKYFFFEFSDETWKDAMYGGVEAHWGLFTADRKLKTGLTLPNCSHP
ncbi:glycoside hydrolase [Acaromyces ingoldii]|uniref:glucan endo-1,3-beta-D-glucosidase n=1 Tax=Acaromyces ingoldii TaxID=215250 RepID=A0A316YQW2_9BASI|nr:glycoside hydrolase [Acaromyces ingoldii]PWN91767.1 glycoside hydrolase [Acaromyces ingoldii]